MDQSNKNDNKSDDCVANGTLSISLPNFDAFNDVEGKAQQITSKVEKIGGLTWQMKVRKVLISRNPTRLYMFIRCNEQVKDNLWLCKVRFKVEAWANGEEEKPFYSSNYGQFYGFNSYCWLFPIKTINYQLKKSALEIKLEIKVCQVLEKSLPALDTNLVVNMGEGQSETLLVNKHSLATLSTYFRNLFFEDWSDKRKRDGNMFELFEPEDFDIRAFKFMLNSAMTMGWMVHESNFLDFPDDLAMAIIKLAIKFDMPMHLDYGQKYLIKAKEYVCRKMILLEFSDQYSLDLLKHHCLKEISIKSFMDDLDKNKQILSRLSKASREQFLAKLDGEKDFKGHSNMKVLDVADQLNLIQLKEHCLKEIKLISFMLNFSANMKIHSRLSLATQKQLQSKLEGEAGGLLDLSAKLLTETGQLIPNQQHIDDMLHANNLNQNMLVIATMATNFYAVINALMDGHEATVDAPAEAAAADQP